MKSEPRRAAASSGAGELVWTTRKVVLLGIAMVLSTLLVVWRQQGKSFMVQQVLRREQFILASGIIGFGAGLLQVGALRAAAPVALVHL